MGWTIVFCRLPARAGQTTGNGLLSQFKFTTMNRRHFIGAAGAAPSLLATQARAQARPLHLKITGLKTVVVNVGSVNWVFCRILTNQGLTGIGEGSVTSKEATVAWT